MGVKRRPGPGRDVMTRKEDLEFIRNIKKPIINPLLKNLPPRHVRFVYEYVATLDHHEAARRCGYPFPTQTGCDLLRKPIIAKIVDLERQKIYDRMSLTSEEVIRQLFYCATREATDFADEKGNLIENMTMLSRRANCSVEGIEQEVFTDVNGNVTRKTKLKLVSKASALNLAMRHLNLFAARKVDVKLSIDWDSLYEERPNGEEKEVELFDSPNLLDNGS